jgi:hypothetical protein
MVFAIRPLPAIIDEVGVVSFSGTPHRLSGRCRLVPLVDLAGYLTPRLA